MKRKIMEKIKCGYCGKEDIKEKMIKQKLYYRLNGESKSRYKWYCNNNQCAGNDQMAHEG